MGKLLAITVSLCIIVVVESIFTCDKICPRRRVRVCDQNGVRYRNLCEFQKAKKCFGGDPRLIKNNCNKFEQNQQVNVANCALSSSEEMPAGCRRKHGNKKIPFVTKVPVIPTTEATAGVYCEENCPLVFEPVCGSDGITYPSRCVLDALSCSREREAILSGQTNHIKLIPVSVGQCPIPSANPTPIIG
ncbi:serine protease inhibitor dipetalogastin-like [Antedon mediterranea]|uniref:serine protease inhibitor dipetalogastin-like n=1 Tax=Antedon mediterranea TaxID=105859 RepID=UPI003AF4ABAF